MKDLTGKGKPFHSALDKAAALLKRKVGTGAEFMKELQGLGGIKQAEIDERKLGEVMGMPRMTHDQFMANLAIRPAPAIQEKVLGQAPERQEVRKEANRMISENARKYASNTADSSGEMRELMADEIRRMRRKHMDDVMNVAENNLDSNNAPYHDKYTLPGGENYREMLIKAPKGGEEFGGVGAHFGGEPDILASLRLKDRTGPNGEKLLHLEELQSDWHQQGREKGYGPKIEKSVEAYYMTKDGQRIPVGFGKTKEEAEANIDVGWKNLVDIKYDNIEQKVGEGVPDAPFKKNWEEMALKRLIHHAAENGYQGIVVTPGKEQADRYSLAKHIDDLHYSGSNLVAYDPEGNEVIKRTGVRPQDLPELVGKELADKLMAQEPQGTLRSLRGVDLEVGGEGMKGFYDKKVPNILNTIGKKYGVKTELNGHQVKINNGMLEPKPEGGYAQTEPETKAVHHFPITEDMRKDILTNGLPLYKEGGIIRKAEGGNVQLTVEQMRQQLMSAGKGLPDISQIGAEEAPNMPVKSFVIPQNGAQGSMPMGGVDMSPMQPGQQMLPANALQPNPLMPQQPQQPQGAPAPLGGAPMPPPQGGSNILQMTPQGQAMAAMKPPMQKADGGMVGLPMTFKIGGSDNMPMNNDYSDNGATDFDIDNIQQLAKGGQPKSLHYDPAPSLKKADIEAMADRMARQISGLDNPNQKTLQQLAREQNLPIGIKSSKKMNVPVINFEELKGASTVGVPGDTSRGGMKPSRGKSMSSPKAGEYLTDIGGEKLDYPVGLYGGKDYGAYGHPAGWASDLGASAGMFNVVKKLYEQNPESDVYGHYHKMSPEALNHAVHMLETVLAHHKPHASDAEKIAHLNKLMRSEKLTTNKSDVPYPSFAGFENPEDIRLQAPFNSGMRKKIINLLGKEKYFPGGKQKLDDIVYAISHPELRNIETGAGGSSIIKFDPTRSLKESLSPHPTYGHDIPSKLAGRTRYITPAELLAPRSMANAKREIAAMGKKVVPFNQAKMNIIREPIDEQYINQLGEYEMAMKKRLGYKKGGAVGKAKVTDNLDTMRLALTRNKKAK